MATIKFDNKMERAFLETINLRMGFEKAALVRRLTAEFERGMEQIAASFSLDFATMTDAESMRDIMEIRLVQTTKEAKQ